MSGFSEAGLPLTWRTAPLLLALLLQGCCCWTNSPPPQPFGPPPVQGRIGMAPACEVEAGSVASSAATPARRRPVSTFSIVAFDPATGDLGVAVQSKFFGVGSVVPWARAKVGAIATQAYANVNYGPEGLDLLQSGKKPAEAVKHLTEADSGRDRRQLGIVDAQGNAAAFTGEKCNAWAGHRQGKHFSAQGNILAGPGVVEAMAEAFEKAQKVEGSELADWLMAALEAGQAAGGDTRGQQSAALLVVRDKAGYGGAGDRYIDLRVEDHAEPIKELARLLEVHKRFYAGAHKNKPVKK